MALPAEVEIATSSYTVDKGRREGVEYVVLVDIDTIVVVGDIESL